MDSAKISFGLLIKRARKTKVLWLIIVCVSNFAGAQDDVHVSVTVAEDFSSLNVSASGVVGSLRGYSDAIWRNIQSIENGDVYRRRLNIADPKLPVSYRVGIKGRDQRRRRWLESSQMLSDWTHWLLMPGNWRMTNPVTLSITVPGNGTAVLPFELLDQKPGLTRYRAYPILPDHGGFSAFGDIHIQSHEVGGRVINTAVIGNVATDKFLGWSKVVVDAAALSHRDIPGANALIAIVPVPSAPGAVPWGHVKRGGGSHVIVYVKETANMQDLIDDWTLFHEVSHLYHPYLRGADRWVSEGFASYFQNLYRGQAGVTTPEFAAERLRAGIERGIKENNRSGRVKVTRGGRMRTYWTAAAMALNADYQIRSRTDGARTLASVMGEFAAAHLPAAKTWRAEDYLTELDQILGFDLMAAMYRETVAGRDLPAVLLDDGSVIEMMEKYRQSSAAGGQ